jgi:hypothetical protein
MKKYSYHFNEIQMEEALRLLEERERRIAGGAEPGHPTFLSYAAIGSQVGATGEAVRLLAYRDMSPEARAARQLAKKRSAALLSLSDEEIAAGWIVCHDMLRLNTSVDCFSDYIRTHS